MKYSLLLALAVALGFLGGLLVVLQAWLLSRIIGSVFLEGLGLDASLPALTWLLAATAARALAAWGGEIAADSLARQVKDELRSRLYTRITQLGPAFLRGERSGELSASLVEGIEALDKYFREYLPQVALAALVPLTLLLLVFPIDWISAVILLVTAPLIPFFMILIGSRAEALTRSRWATLSRMSAHCLDVLQGLAELKALGRSKAQAGVIGEVSGRFRAQTLAVLRVAFLSALALELLTTLSTALIAVGIGLRLLYGQLEFREALFVLLLAPDFYLPLRMLGTRFHAGMSGTAAAARLFQILDQPLENSTDSQPLPAQGWQALEFAEVSFSYPGETENALSQISFTLKKGKKIALVGPSGGGKSTVFNLLLGFDRPQQGAVLLDGQPLAGFAMESWRSQIAWAPQSPYLFDDTVSANIRLGKPDAIAEEVQQAARLAQADEFIRSLPQGYDTPIGERGLRLSGGQAQRIALARAFLQDAPLVLLDEPTANLDPALEAELSQAVERLLENRAALVIAHRLKTIRNADHILVLAGGRIVQQGCHAELSQQSGLYRQLLEAGESLASPELQAETAAALHTQPQSAFTLEFLPGRGDRPLPESLATHPAGWKTFLRLFGFLKPLRSRALLAVLLGAGTIASGIGLLGTSAYLISLAAIAPTIAPLQVPIVGVRFFGIARGVLRYLERYTSHDLTFRLLAELRLWFYRALEPLAPARLLGKQSADLLSRITADIDILENFYIRVVSAPLIALPISLLTALILGAFHPALALVLLLFHLLAGLAVPWVIRKLSTQPSRTLVTSRAALNRALVDGIQGLADLSACRAQTRQAQKINAWGERFSQAQTALARLNGLQSALELWLSQGALWLVLILAIPLVEAGLLEGVYLALLALLTLSSFEALHPLPLAAAHLESSLQAGERLFEIVDTQPAVTDPPSPLPAPQQFDLEARRLTFRYPGETQPALHDVSFGVKAGQKIALVGASGGGKSTLVSLLLRFWEIGEGQILASGDDIRLFSQDEWRKRLAVVSQRAHLFNASLRENLLIANPRASQEQLDSACRSAQIFDFIQSLPQGYETLIGEQGLRLSGGERQRLALARALLQDAHLLVLDEPFSHLDALTARQVWGGLQAAWHGRPLLLISHQLIGLDDVDEILVLEGGRVIERGSQAELLRLNGAFARMLRLQSQAETRRG